MISANVGSSSERRPNFFMNRSLLIKRFKYLGSLSSVENFTRRQCEGIAPIQSIPLSISAKLYNPCVNISVKKTHLSLNIPSRRNSFTPALPTSGIRFISSSSMPPISAIVAR